MNPYEREKQEVAEMFDGVAESGSLGGIMGNEACNAFEIGKIKEAFVRLCIQEKNSLLEGGIGVGRLVDTYKALGFGKITGVDISPKMLAKCADLHPDVELHRMDLCDMAAFTDGQFDVTALIYTLIHIVDDPQLDRAIAEVERVTRNEVVVAQVMEPERQGSHGGHCKVREVYDLIKRFRKKRVYRFLKNFHEVRATDRSWTNKVSFLVMK